jgi:hypothetical protein
MRPTDLSQHTATVPDMSRHEVRELSWQLDDDGCWVLKGRFAPEQGAVIQKALEKALDQQFAEREDEHPDVSAETPRGGVPEYMRPQPVATRRADALERLAESFLAGTSGNASGGDRYLINIHTEADVLPADGEGTHAECDDGGHVSAENARQVLSLSEEKGLEITAKSLWTEWTGEPIDYCYAQELLEQYDPGDS